MLPSLSERKKNRWGSNQPREKERVRASCPCVLCSSCWPDYTGHTLVVMIRSILLIRCLRMWRRGIPVSRKLCGRCSSLGGVWVLWMLTWFRIKPGRRFRLLVGGLMRENMVNVRGPCRVGWPDLTDFNWWSEGDNVVADGVMILCVGAAVGCATNKEFRILAWLDRESCIQRSSFLSCAVSLSVVFFSSPPSCADVCKMGRRSWLKGVSAIVWSVVRWWLIAWAPEISSEPYWAGTHAYVGCPDGSWSCLWGVAKDQERVCPCSMSLRMLIQGLWVGTGLIIQYHYEVLAICCALD